MALYPTVEFLLVLTRGDSVFLVAEEQGFALPGGVMPAGEDWETAVNRVAAQCYGVAVRAESVAALGAARNRSDVAVPALTVAVTVRTDVPPETAQGAYFPFAALPMPLAESTAEILTVARAAVRS